MNHAVRPDQSSTFIPLLNGPVCHSVNKWLCRRKKAGKVPLILDSMFLPGPQGVLKLGLFSLEEATDTNKRASQPVFRTPLAAIRESSMMCSRAWFGMDDLYCICLLIR